MECWNCGGIIDRDMQFCKWCGAELERTQQYSQAEFGEHIEKEQVLEEDPLQFGERLNSSRIKLDDARDNTPIAPKLVTKHKATAPKKHTAKSPIQKKKALKKPKYDMYLLISFFVSIAYYSFIIVYFWNTIFYEFTNNFMLSHCLGGLIALVLNWCGLIYKQEGFMLSAAILYAITALFYIPGSPFMLVAAALCFLGYFIQNRKNRRILR